MELDECLGEALSGQANRLGPARVSAFEDGLAVVELDRKERSAIPAVPGYRPEAGDRALVIGNERGDLYIIGVLSTARGRTRFAVDDGDLEFVTARGATRFVSEGGIEMTSARPVEIRSRLGVVLSVLGRAGRLLPRLSLTPERTELRNTELRMASEVSTHEAGHSYVQTERLDVRARELAAYARTARLTADALFTRVRSAYARAAELWQVTARRTRMVVRGTSHHKAERIYSRAEKDVKLKADQVHLG